MDLGSREADDMDEPSHALDIPAQPPSPRSALRVAKAREAFLRSEQVPSGVVRQSILASWTRSRDLQVDPGHLDLGSEKPSYRSSPLLKVASQILDDIADRMSTEPMSVILCDDQGVVLDRRIGDSGLRHHLDKVWLAPGFSYAEGAVGTNAIGTSLESRGPAYVFGHEHYVNHLENLACASVPICHPITGRLLGVLDLTGWVRDANALMMATATMIAHSIQDNLLDQAGRGEVALLHDYLAACHRNRGAVLAISDDLVMMNDNARELLDPGDQSPLIAAAGEALAGRRRRQIVIDLPSGATARVHCRPSGGETGTPGGVLEVVLVSRDDSVGRPGPARAPLPLPATVGSGALWVKCGQAVDRHALAREWLILSGEPGSGRRTVARAAHQMRFPAAHLRVLAAQDHKSWLPEVADELEDEAGTLILADIDQLPPAAVEALTEALEPYREDTDASRPWVVATTGTGKMDGALARLVDCFPRTIEVPPLRHHVEDVPELVAHFVAKLTHGSDLTFSAEAMRVLRRNRWPGNVEQLQQVVRKVLAKRRSGVVEVTDLPAEIGASARRVLSTIEAIECDAIVEALLETRGNKAEAAAVLGVSRATVYRKVREYGITMPRPARPARPSA